MARMQTENPEWLVARPAERKAPSRVVSPAANVHSLRTSARSARMPCGWLCDAELTATEMRARGRNTSGSRTSSNPTSPATRKCDLSPSGRSSRQHCL